MPVKLGQRSRDKLMQCVEPLIRVINRAELMAPYDFTVLETLRSDQRQKDLYRQGPHVTPFDGVIKRSKHQADKNGKARAIDLAPYPIDWQDLRGFSVLAGVVLAAARAERVWIRWGGDWDGDGTFTDQTFHDLPHFEVME